jgi:hypothetical protein
VTTKLNKKLLEKVVTWAVADHESDLEMLKKFEGWGIWDQGQWFSKEKNGECKTAYCLAGAAVTQSGWGMILDVIDTDSTGKAIAWEAEACAPVIEYKKNGQPKKLDESRMQQISHVGREVLGLEYERNEHELFDGDNDIEDVVTMAYLIAANHGVSLKLPLSVAKYLDVDPEDIRRSYNTHKIVPTPKALA